jgi:hypothetical protein
MLKKFLGGLVFGAGFAVAAIIVVVVYFHFFFTPTFEKTITSSPDANVIGTPPSIQTQKRFLGSQGIFNGEFKRSNDVLSAGPGEIVGKVTANEEPVAGVKLRFALNGNVMSQWATSGADGAYSVSVPYGKYRIDGYELDREAADSVLAGKISLPHNPFSSKAFVVARDSKGYGPNLGYVDPIELNIPKQKYSLSENIVIGWAPYPDASQYSIQLYEKSDPYEFGDTTTLFDWRNRPKISGTAFDLKENGIKLKAGKFYVVEISAQDKNGGMISQTANSHTGYDFEVTE